jgi:asparagine synthase (glutamine-hydrolysing)
MCGINGIYNFSGQHIADIPELLKGMNASIAHRGPDDSGEWNTDDQKLFLGHRRLSIIDLSAGGHQPMIDAASNAIVFNGEIYNYKDLKKTLPEKTYKSESDTEVLMHLLNSKGMNGLKELNGMYAFAWWHQKEQKLFLVRDRLGKKPLYYTVQNGILAFSSEIRALLTLPWVVAQPDDEALYHFLTFNQVAAPKTLFHNIYKLEPASYLVADKKGVEEKSVFWDIEYTEPSEKTEADICDRLHKELSDAVARRMVADVPVGAFLSGGVDSSAIVAYMNQLGFSKIKTYSVGFSNQPDYTELKYAENISKKYKTEHFEKIVEPNDLKELLPEMAAVFDEPLADATAIPIWFISKLARENGTIVVQTGDGSDELFCGYRNWLRYAKLYPWFHLYEKFPGWIKRGIAQISGARDASSAASEMLQRAVRKEEFFWGGAKAFKESTKHNFLTEEWQTKMQYVHSYTVISKVKEVFDRHKSLHHLNDIDWMCYLGVKQQIPERYLHRMDKLGMANSIEIRSPFLDYKLVNYALSIPSSLKIKNNEPKYILKKTLEGTLDHETLYRKKMGFCVPLREWAGEVMIDYVKTNLDRFCNETRVFDKKGLQRLIVEIENGNEGMTNQLYTIYFLMAWYEHWIY